MFDFIRKFFNADYKPASPQRLPDNRVSHTLDQKGSHLDLKRRVFIQRKLRNLGLNKAEKNYADLVPAAIAAVKKFQTLHGLEVDGIVGPVTWRALVNYQPGPVVIENEKTNAPWYKRALRDEGLREIPGPKHNPRVLEMFEIAGHPNIEDDETAWCSASLNTWMIEGGLKGTGSLLARSWLDWGREIDRVVKGAVAVFERGNSSWMGHVALCTGRETATHIEILGGNQNNQVNRKWADKSELLGLRWAA